MKNLNFILPAKGSIQPNDNNDPLPFYYKPLIGRLYCKRIEQAVSLLSPPYKSILEIGYGSGILMPTLCSLSKRVVGLDLNSEPEKVKSHLIKIGCAPLLYKENVQNMNFSDHEFDLIVSISTFEHIKLCDIESICKKLFHILTPGGKLLIGMPRVDKFMGKMFSLIGFSKINEHHITTPQEFISVAEKFFELEQMKHMPTPLPKFMALYYNMLFTKPR